MTERDTPTMIPPPAPLLQGSVGRDCLPTVPCRFPLPERHGGTTASGQLLTSCCRLYGHVQTAVLAYVGRLSHIWHGLHEVGPGGRARWGVKGWCELEQR